MDEDFVDHADQSQLMAVDLEQLQQEDALYPWLADGSMEEEQ